jgi:hypothetical protein
MIAHIVLFTPKASLHDHERETMISALETACRDIPQIKRVQLGRRRVLGYQYDGLAPVHFEFLLILGFDSAEDLDTYLHHPAHVALGDHFSESSEAALALDFEVGDVSRIRAIANPASS